MAEKTKSTTKQTSNPTMIVKGGVPRMQKPPPPPPKKK